MLDNIEIEKFARRDRLKLPNDSQGWKRVNEAIAVVIPTIRQAINYNDLDTAMDFHEVTVYDTILQACGTVSNPTQDSNKGRRSFNRDSKPVMRKAKRRLKKEYLKAIAIGSPAEEIAATKQRFYQIMHQFNAHRKRESRVKEKKEAAFQQMQFQKDPWQFSKKIFDPPLTGKPSFGEEECYSHFKKTYTDKDRSVPFQPLPDMTRPPPPKVLFKGKPPSLKQLEKIVLKKKARNAPGMNGLPYLVYKKCPALLKLLELIYVRVWKEKRVPRQWQMAIIILLQKKADVSSPGVMRPIALLNVEGRIFFTDMQHRLSRFMIDNKYWDTQLQKGFLEKVAGCIEHSEVLMAAFQDAKRHSKPICVSLIDLANAYGSVNHPLIQFALKWYHVPPTVCTIFRHYYDALLACIIVPGSELSTEVVHLGIGVFQGCCASTIVFNVAYQLKVDYTSTCQDLGYKFTDTDETLAQNLFADDDSAITEEPAANQVILSKSAKWLKWSRTLKGKPTKCRAIAFCRFLKKHSKYQKLQNKQYSAYDPQLELGGEPVPCMWTEEFLFKYLGRLMQADLNDDVIRKTIVEKFERLMKLLDETKITGMMKVWVYEHKVAAMMSWVLMIHDLPPSWVEFHLQRTATRMLKKWTGLARPANVNIFFRSKEHFGLHLKHMSEFTKRLQVLRSHILKYSNDNRVRKVYEMNLTRHSSEMASPQQGATWRPTLALERAEAAVHTQQIVGAANLGHQGLGYGKAKLSCTNSRQEHRKKVCNQVEADAETKRFAEEADHAVQGCWQKWSQAEAADTSWKRLLYQMSPDIVRFWLNATMDTCPTPANLERWKLKSLGQCDLCGNRSGNLQHILNVCSKSLIEGRYTWRHDSVLNVVQEFVQIAVNRGKAIAKKGGRPQEAAIKFVKAGQAAPAKKRAPTRPDTMLEQTDDWETKFDLNYDENGIKRGSFFPESVLATGQLPDGIIWSMSKRIIYLLELSCSWEERHVDAHIRKKRRYENISATLQRDKWTVHNLPFEVGSRGYLSSSVNFMFKQLGLSSAERKQARTRIAETSLLCSYMIYLRRSTPVWDITSILRKYSLKTEAATTAAAATDTATGSATEAVSDTQQTEADTTSSTANQQSTNNNTETM